VKVKVLGEKGLSENSAMLAPTSSARASISSFGRKPILVTPSRKIENAPLPSLSKISSASTFVPKPFVAERKSIEK
jgi:hypothetical protein